MHRIVLSCIIWSYFNVWSAHIIHSVSIQNNSFYFIISYTRLLVVFVWMKFVVLMQLYQVLCCVNKKCLVGRVIVAPPPYRLVLFVQYCCFIFSYFFHFTFCLLCRSVWLRMYMSRLLYASPVPFYSCCPAPTQLYLIFPCSFNTLTRIYITRTVFSMLCFGLCCLCFFVFIGVVVVILIIIEPRIL